MPRVPICGKSSPMIFFLRVHTTFGFRGTCGTINASDAHLSHRTSWTISNSKQTMSSNRKHNVETPSGSGPSSNKPASSEQWKEFWAHAKSQKRRKKTLTREESRRRRQKKMDQNIGRNVIQRMKQNKPVIHLLNDPKVARLLTEADFCLWDSQT